MFNWKQAIGIYIALIIGGIASIFTYFVEYILILIVALGLVGITLYEENKKLHEYQMKEMERKKD